MVVAGVHGHLNPHLPVIAELVERGHQVSFAVPASFADIVATTGANPLVYASGLPDESRGQRWPSEPVAGMTVFLDEAIRVFPRLEAALEGDRPDVVLYDIGGYPGRALARHWGLPVAQLSPAFVAWDGFEADMGENLAFTREGSHLRGRWVACFTSPLCRRSNAWRVCGRSGPVPRW